MAGDGPAEKVSGGELGCAVATPLGSARAVSSHDNPDDLRRIESEVKKNILKCAPGANSITKEIVLATRNLDKNSLVKFAAQGFANSMMSDEGKEGIAAFVEKRKPKWSE